VKGAGGDDRLLAMFVRALDKLQRERDRIDERLGAMSTAYEALAGDAPNGHRVNGGRVRRKLQKNGKRLDPNWHDNTYALLKPAGEVSVRAVARMVGITMAGAGTRLGRMVKLGTVERVGRGRYRAVAK
jgi:hypothetical protein